LQRQSYQIFQASLYLTVSFSGSMGIGEMVNCEAAGCPDQQAGYRRPLVRQTLARRSPVAACSWFVGRQRASSPHARGSPLRPCGPAAATSCESVVNRTVARRPISVSADGGEIVRNYWASGLWTQYVICLLLGYLPSDGPLKLMKKGPGKNKRPGCLQPPPRRLLDAPSPSFPSLMAECFLGG